MKRRYTITSYAIEIAAEGATLALNGTDASNLVQRGTRVATVHYATGVEARQFINRGGWLQIYRPLDLLAATADLLRNESPVYLDEDGTFSTVTEPVGESGTDTE